MIYRKPSASDIDQINKYIKNKLDISDLIKDLDLSGLDLSLAIIKHIERYNVTLKKVNFYGAKIGCPGKVSVLENCKLLDCSFDKVITTGKLSIKQSNLSGSTFIDADFSKCNYQYADLSNCTFCGIILKLGTGVSYGAKFSPEFLRDLVFGSNVNITVNE